MATQKLQDVLAALSDEEALAVWHALAAHVENEKNRQDDEACEIIDAGGELDGGLCAPVVERLDGVVAQLAESF